MEDPKGFPTSEPLTSEQLVQLGPISGAQRRSLTRSRSACSPGRLRVPLLIGAGIGCDCVLCRVTWPVNFSPARTT